MQSLFMYVCVWHVILEFIDWTVFSVISGDIQLYRNKKEYQAKYVGVYTWNQNYVVQSWMQFVVDVHQKGLVGADLIQISFKHTWPHTLKDLFHYQMVIKEAKKMIRVNYTMFEMLWLEE